MHFVMRTPTAHAGGTMAPRFFWPGPAVQRSSARPASAQHQPHFGSGPERTRVRGPSRMTLGRGCPAGFPAASDTPLWPVALALDARPDANVGTLGAVQVAPSVLPDRAPVGPPPVVAGQGELGCLGEARLSGAVSPGDHGEPGAEGQAQDGGGPDARQPVTSISLRYVPIGSAARSTGPAWSAVTVPTGGGWSG